MNGVILNETTLLNMALNGEKVIKGDVPNILAVLTRYYFSKGLNKEEVYHKLNNYYKSIGIGYNETVSYDFIQKLINRIYNSGRFNLIDITAITISTDEWDRIISLNDKSAEKLAFSILVYQKISEVKNPKSNGWVNIERSYLLKDAGLTKVTKEDKLNFHKLIKCGFLSKKNSVDATGYLVNYRDNSKTLSPPKIIITNFEKIITYYDEHRNGVKYRECEVCGKRFKIAKTGKPPKYCSVCAKKMKSKKTVDARKNKKI